MGPSQFDAGPTDPTSVKTARFVYAGCTPSDTWCSVSCTLDGTALPQQQCYSPVLLSVNDGVHMFTLTVTTLVAQRPVLSWAWSVLPLVIDAVSAQAVGVSRGSISIPLQTGPAVSLELNFFCTRTLVLSGGCQHYLLVLPSSLC